LRILFLILLANGENTEGQIISPGLRAAAQKKRGKKGLTLLNVIFLAEGRPGMIIAS
jgi:hypothetical protein